MNPFCCFQRDARHIIVTSRSGGKSLETNTNVVVCRMFEYLEAKDDLRLSLVAVDATDVASTTALLNTIGCTRIKLDAFAVAKEVIDFQSMDFIVSFTSVSVLFGFGGQTNYGA